LTRFSIYERLGHEFFRISFGVPCQSFLTRTFWSARYVRPAVGHDLAAPGARGDLDLGPARRAEPERLEGGGRP
jgi:hypothetical protein